MIGCLFLLIIGVYLFPFYELDKIRKQIIADLKLENI